MKLFHSALIVCTGLVLYSSASIASTISVASGAESAKRDRQRAAGRHDPAGTRRRLTPATSRCRQGFVDGLTSMITDPHDRGRRSRRRRPARAPSKAPQLAQDPVGSNSVPAIQTAPGAHHWRLMLLEIVGNGGATSSRSVTARARSRSCRTCRTTSSSIASTSTATRRRARSAASRSTARRRRSPGRTSPTSRRSARTRRRSAAGTAPDRSPSRTTTSKPPARTCSSAAPIRRSRIWCRPTSRSPATSVSKPIAWRSQNWVVKNLLELKNARRVFVSRQHVRVQLGGRSDRATRSCSRFAIRTATARGARSTT